MSNLTELTDSLTQRCARTWATLHDKVFNFTTTTAMRTCVPSSFLCLIVCRAAALPRGVIIIARGAVTRVAGVQSATSATSAIAFVRAPLGLRQTFMAPAWKIKQPTSPSVLEGPGGELPALLDGRKGARWVVFGRGAPRNRPPRNRLEKRLRMSAARWLCSGHRLQRTAWLDSYAWGLLTSASCSDLPPTAREAGPSWPRRASRSPRKRAAGRQ